VVRRSVVCRSSGLRAGRTTQIKYSPSEQYRRLVLRRATSNAKHPGYEAGVFGVSVKDWRSVGPYCGIGNLSSARGCAGKAVS
jgi:hypothetical protein